MINDSVLLVCEPIVSVLVEIGSGTSLSPWSDPALDSCGNEIKKRGRFDVSDISAPGGSAFHARMDAHSLPLRRIMRCAVSTCCDVVCREPGTRWRGEGHRGVGKD